MTYCATPILYLNMGGEMLYVLQQRLQTQKISADKTIQVLNDVIYALLNPRQLGSVFEPGPTMGLEWLRPALERVVLSSIMKLDANSMDKLFDLMIMMTKYQLAMSSGPREILLSTLNHLDAVRDMAVDRNVRELVDCTHRIVIEGYGQMTHKELWQIRDECLKEIQHHNVRVSILIRLGMQNHDASFNRLVQRYDEKYQERKDVLENLKLAEYQDDAVAGSLDFYGNRVTLLGKNVYSSSYGHFHGNRINQNMHHIVAVSNKSMKRELDALATQLGKEEAAPIRPFSLHLFSNNNDKFMDCTPDANKNNILPVEHEGDNSTDAKNTTLINDYKNNLIDNVNSEFADNDPPSNEAMDLLSFFDNV